MKYCMIAFAVLTLSGCGAMQPKTEYVEISKPILACPPPPGIHRPTLAINSLTPADKKNYGKVAKAYKATVFQLQRYAEELEMVVDGYKEVSKNYNEAKKLTEGARLPQTVVDPLLDE